MRQYSDTKDRLQASQAEVKNLRRVLAREVGDTVDLDKVCIPLLVSSPLTSNIS